MADCRALHVQAVLSARVHPCSPPQDPWCVPARADQIQRFYPAATRTDINSGHCESGGWGCQAMLMWDRDVRAAQRRPKCEDQCLPYKYLPSPHLPAHTIPPMFLPAGPHDDTPELVNERLLQWLAGLEAKAASA